MNDNHGKNLIAALSVMMLVSACGKNLHTALDNEAGKSKPTQTLSDLTLKQNEAKKELRVIDAQGNVSLTVALEPVPADQLKDLELPFLNAGNTDAEPTVVSVGKAVLQTKAGLKFAKNSNVVAQVTLPLPKDATLLKSISSLKLTFKGLRVLDAKKDETLKTSVNQVLCLLSVNSGVNECTGEVLSSTDEEQKNLNESFWKFAETPGTAAIDGVADDKSDDKADGKVADKTTTGDTKTASTDASAETVKTVTTQSALFAELELGKILEELDSGEVIRGSEKETLEIDLVKALNLTDSTAVQLIEYLYGATTEIKGNVQERLLRISLGNSIYADEIMLQFTAKADPVNYKHAVEKKTDAKADAKAEDKKDDQKTDQTKIK